MAHAIYVVAFGAIVAGFVQGLSGFAFGLVAMSFWAWTLEPRLAAALVVFGSLTGQIAAAVSMRRGFEPRTLVPFLVGGLVGIPIGVSVLPFVDADVFKAGLGVLLAVWCPLMLAAPRLSRVAFGGRTADGVAGLAGGVLGGIGGFTGAVPTLWCTLRHMEKDVQRSVIQNFNLATLSVTMATYVGRGLMTIDMLPMLAIVAAAMLVPTLAGIRFYAWISPVAFRKIILTLLTLSGVVLLAASVPHLIRRWA